MFKAIEDLDLADKLAEAGLLWYTHDGASGTFTWEWLPLDETNRPSKMQAKYQDYTFYILLED